MRKVQRLVKSARRKEKREFVIEKWRSGRIRERKKEKGRGEEGREKG